MTLVCGQCSRVNPPEAAYCFHDGAALAGRAGGPINAGSAPFPNQFVFPDGLACRNFDQLALACQQNWPAAVKLLQQGFLGSFFGGMGRVDLAMAAQDAAKFPDLDRGLDQLLAKLPTQALQPPKLQAEPSAISLGQVKIGENRHTELHLTNLGMRLVYGTVTSNCKWLTLGEAPGHPEKLFQFGVETVIPVQVHGQHLRAGAKAIEGKLEVDSNGGPIEVIVRADVAITPFAGGLFAGAVTPRQIAEKAKANVKDAVPYFERGDVAKWYASNGWDYPVKGPIMPSTGSIQQFFEALGVAKAPKVEFSPKSLDLHSAVGKTIDATLEVSTTERKVVYGWASCDQPWVEVGATKLHGKSATVPITIRIPDPAPPTLQATVTVMGNGMQRFAVPLRVTVAGGKAGVAVAAAPEVEETAPIVVLDEDVPVVQLLEEPPPTVVTAPTPTMEAPAASAPPPSAPLAVQQLADDNPFAIDTPGPAKPGAWGAAPTITLPKPKPGMPLLARVLLHFVPLALLCFACLILLVADLISPGKQRSAAGDDEDVDTANPYVMLKFDEGRQGGEHYTDSMMFALHELFPEEKGKSPKKLNWYENGFGNSVVLKIDKDDKAFGIAPKHGRWVDVGKDTQKYTGKRRTFDIDGIYVTQTVTIVPGEPVEVKPGEYKRFLNTCLVRYSLENKEKKSHFVGLRVLVDTCIGENDGVPFTLPGVKEVVKDKREFLGADVPDFIEVIEKESLRDPGTVVHLNLRVGDFEMPNRFLVTHYPGNDPKVLHKWDVPLVPIYLAADDPRPDSSVVIYWDPKELKPNQKRELAYTYGLGKTSLNADKLSVSIGGASHVKGELSVVALVADTEAKTVTIKLPDGLQLLKGQNATQPVERPRPDKSGKIRPNPVTWRVQAVSEGKHTVVVSTDTGAAQQRRVTISAKSLFN